MVPRFYIFSLQLAQVCLGDLVSLCIHLGLKTLQLLTPTFSHFWERKIFSCLVPKYLGLLCQIYICCFVICLFMLSCQMYIYVVMSFIYIYINVAKSYVFFYCYVRCIFISYMYIHVVMLYAGRRMIHEPGQGTEHGTVITGFYSLPTTLSNTGRRTITPNKGLRVLWKKYNTHQCQAPSIMWLNGGAHGLVDWVFRQLNIF